MIEIGIMKRWGIVVLAVMVIVYGGLFLFGREKTDWIKYQQTVHNWGEPTPLIFEEDGI